VAALEAAGDALPLDDGDRHGDMQAGVVVMTEPKLRIDDVDDVIGLAAELMQQDQETLGVEDLKEVGAELDIPPEYIDRARTELRQRRERETEARQVALATRQRRVKVGAISAAVVLVVSLLWGSSAVSTLREHHADVEAARAQVDNVRARKEAVVQQLAGRPESADKDAELIGAENRIRVETKRYADAAARYNAARGGFPASWLAPMVGLPDAVAVAPY
jgi:hypothetical protein